jgi:UMF1 family MFS transporter
MPSTQQTVSQEPTPVTQAPARELWSWAFYDFANSGYATVVLTTIYSAFFVGVIAADLDREAPGTATLLWTMAIAAANLVVLISAPVLGAIADHRACKKTLLMTSSIVCVIATALLATAGPGQIPLALGLLVLSAIAFASGENFIAAFLPEIAPSGKMGRISGYGWSLGYFGGLLTLASCLAYINWASERGDTAADYVPVTLIITAAIFAVAAIPTFLWLRERAQPASQPQPRSYILLGLGRVKTTLSHARQLPDLFRFLICLTIYQAGVATVIVIAAIYAQEVMGFSSQQLIVLIMVVNFAAAIGAFIFGFAQDRFGSIPSLVVALLVWIAAGLISFATTTASGFWVAGLLIGAAMGATQAGGRALIGRFTPLERSGEFFGLWGLAARAAAIIGPLSYGIINRLSAGDHRIALLSTLTFFVVGLLLLLRVNEANGVAARLQPLDH